MKATIKKTIFAAAFASLALGATAEINVDFESPASYKGIGVWDAWEHSPFRLGELAGNYAVTANPDRNVSEITGQIPNDSEMVLGAQRSRFGSNRFGVKIDLPETFELVPQVKYVHVMLYKTETNGRVMLMGLGSRQERKGQDPYTLQFSSMCSNAIEPGRWFDAVFAVKGAGGIDIRSLVVVPDCESPHDRSTDFLFYVDDIVVNDSPTPRVNNEYYPINGAKASSEMNRTDRGAKGIYLICDNDTTTFAHDQSASKKLYADLTSKTFYAKPGQTVTPGINYNGTWMHSYCYVDFGNDGNFNTSNELVAYNYYEGKNSAGQNAAQNPGNNVGKMPGFTIPADTKPGMYRIRFKVDWDCIDPAGNPGVDGKNVINDNGGAIIDAMLCVYGNNVTVNDFQLNGEVLAGNGDKLNAYQVPADKAFTIKSAPENGFHNGGVNLNFGFNLDGDAVDKYGNPQYTTIFVPASSFDDNELYTIPANMMRGDLLINGNMVEDGPAGPCAEGYFLNFPEDLKLTRDDRKLNSLALQTPEGTVTINIPAAESKLVYQNKLSVEVPVKAGETVTPSVDYTGRAMHTYWYVDLNEDGFFSNDLNADGTPAGEMLSYSHFNGKNSLGTAISGTPGSITPALNHPFAIPAGTAEGLDRCRLKIDWSNTDSGGQYGLGSNDIDANGGYVVDLMLHVHGTTSTVTSADALTANGNALPYEAPRSREITIAPTTTEGKTIKSLIARYGYHLDGRSTRYTHVYWREADLSRNADNAFVVPAEVTDRPVSLIAEIDNIDGLVEIELVNSTDTRYDMLGRPVKNGSRGIVISNGKKTIVR